MSEEHRRRTDHNGNTAHERKTDADYIARLGETIERYKIFWLIIMAILGWWGRTIMEPLRTAAQTTAEVRLINQKIDSVIVPRLDVADQDRAQMIRIQETQTKQIGTLSRLTCLHTSLVDRVKIDINCKDIPIETPRLKGGF
jgi:hypothetical protein